MAITNYTELQAALRNWSAKGASLDAVLPDFIALAEVAIFTKFRARALTKALSVAYAPAATSITLPADFISARTLQDSAASGRSGQVEIVSAERLTELRLSPASADRTKTQLYVTARDATFVFPPAASGTISGLYLAKEPALSGATPTNYILANFPDIYLFGALFELADYQKDNDAAIKHKARFDEALTRANEQAAYLNQDQVFRAPRMTVV